MAARRAPRTRSNGHGGSKRARALPVLDSGRTQVPCLTCALCCSYVTVEIDGPDNLECATQILWHLYHEGVSIYLDDDEWLLQFETRCNHLQDDFKCAIYEQRPPICRNFDETTCEVNAVEVGVTFNTPAEFLAYLKLHHRRIYSLIERRYMPDPSALAGKPQSRNKLPLSRFNRLRAMGAPRS